MPSPPPPLPVSREEFRRRRRAGARTMKELDPNFDRWLDHSKRMRRIGIIGVVLLFTWLLVELLWL